MPIRQSFCYPIFREGDEPLADLCRFAAEVGYEAVELWGWQDSLGELAEAARSAGLVVASMGGHGGIESGLNDPTQHDRIEAELRASIDAAAEFGVPGLITFSGFRRGEQSDADGMIQCARGLRRIIGYAEEKGVNLNMELLNSRVDHPPYQCDRVDWGLALCEMVGSPRAKLLFDIYHVQIMEGDVIRHIRRAAPHIGHFHTAGNPGRNEMDDTQELNYRAICRAIVETGYDLYLGHEFFPKRTPKHQALKDAYAICHVPA